MGALAVLGSPFSSGALASFQQQQLYIKNHRLNEYDDCYLLIHVHHGNWVEVLMDYGLRPLRDAFRCVQCELRIPVEMWMVSDLFSLKMVDGGQVNDVVCSFFLTAILGCWVCKLGFKKCRSLTDRVVVMILQLDVCSFGNWLNNLEIWVWMQKFSGLFWTFHGICRFFLGWKLNFHLK